MKSGNMKGKAFFRRATFAAAGLGHAFRSERSFRTQSVAALAAMAATIALRPGWVWGALIAVAIVLVLALELVNTALEHLIDGLHPGEARFIQVAKDCAAGAVLIASVLSLLLFGMMLLAQAY